jgi:hypothetical protein
MRRTFASAAWVIVAVAGSVAALGTGSSCAGGLNWEVENPLRFFKDQKSFALHEAAFASVRGHASAAALANPVWRTERALNDPDCRDASSPDRCAATAGRRYQQSRMGWAAQTVVNTCYEKDGRPRRYPAVCERKYSWGQVKEDYVLPEAHTVALWLAPDVIADQTAECLWTWQPLRPNGKTETRRMPCKQRLTIARVPYAIERAHSGVSVSVKLPDGRELTEPELVVEDLFIVALGDSFASGESNPDQPVQFSASREMIYDPSLAQSYGVARMLPKQTLPGYGLASSSDHSNPKVLPRRYMEDEAAGRYYPLGSREFVAAFEKANARWLSRDCHRSQYGYPLRVAMQLALENRHRAVTFATFACSGAEIHHGLFGEVDAREGAREVPRGKVAAQLDQLSDLICRGEHSQTGAYTLPLYAPGGTTVTEQKIAKSWCPPQLRKRGIDLVLLSIGGNDVGFSALAAFSLTEQVSDLAPIAGLVGSSMRFGPQVAQVYLDVLDRRMKALKDALHDGFGVAPARVVQSSYEPIQFDEAGGVCGLDPTLGMDVHPGLRLGRQQLGETAQFLDRFLKRLECIASTKRRADCPARLATGSGTGFALVTEHIPEFSKRGLCARDPARATTDGSLMRVPRRPGNGDEFRPYSPASTLPYAHRWRLFRTPNDAFLTANSHREGMPLFDILQPAYAALYSGAIHPTAEAHAIVADHVLPHARRIVDAAPALQESSLR